MSRKTESYPSAQKENRPIDYSPHSACQIRVKLIHQQDDCRSRTTDNPTSSLTKQQHRNKSGPFLPTRPIERIIGIIRGLRDQDDIRVPLVLQMMGSYDLASTEEKIPSSNVTVPSVASNSFKDRNVNMMVTIGGGVSVL